MWSLTDNAQTYRDMARGNLCHASVFTAVCFRYFKLHKPTLVATWSQSLVLKFIITLNRLHDVTCKKHSSSVSLSQFLKVFHFCIVPQETADIPYSNVVLTQNNASVIPAIGQER
jgi:hypothetical protein